MTDTATELVEEPTEELSEEELAAEFDDDLDNAESSTEDVETVEKNDKTETVVEKTEEEIKEEAAQKVIDDAKVAEDAKTPEELEAEAKQKLIDDAKIESNTTKVEPVKKVETVELTAEQKEAAQKKVDDANAQSRTDFLTDMDDKLKDIVIGDGGEEGSEMPKSMAEFAEQFPEIANTMKQYASFVRENIMTELNPLRESIADNQAKASNDALVSELSSDKFGHADVSEIVESAEFQDWVADQTPAYQSYVDSATTAQDVSAVLSTYKAQAGIETKTSKASEEVTAKKAEAKKVADKQRDDKKEGDKLNKVTTRSHKSTEKKDKNSEEDLEGAFNEELGDD